MVTTTYMKIRQILNNILYIVEGYINWLYDKITGKTKQLSKYRLSICEKCKYNNNGICSQCGCILQAKTRVDFMLDENGISIGGCPENKW